MPIAPPSQTGLDLTRPPTLTAARAAPTRGDTAAATGFSVGAAAAEAGGPAARAASPESFRRFEAMVLQTFIQNMLPKDGAAVYGKGMAGDMWKSLLAEKMADAMAERGGIGIADRMLGGHYPQETRAAGTPDAIRQPATTAGETGEVTRPVSLAPAVLDGMRRSLSELLAGDIASSGVPAQSSSNKRG